MRVLELFCGIGGAATAAGGAAVSAGVGAEVAAAVDHDRDALLTYGENFPHRVVVRNLARVPAAWFASFGADTWWMSPPCQPHGIRGAQRDLDDPRSEAFRTVVQAIREVRPRAIGLENVPWFAGSASWRLLRDALDECGYGVEEREVDATHLGLPVERRRFYLAAVRDGAPAPLDPPFPTVRPLREFVSADPDPALAVEPELAERFGGAFHVVDADDDRAVAACFTAAYGRSPVYCGSYLRQGGTLRRFAPEEILALHGFPRGFRFPAGLPLKRRYTQAGHSVPVPAVALVLGAVRPTQPT